MAINNVLNLSSLAQTEEMGPTCRIGRTAGSSGPKEDLQPGNLFGLVGTTSFVCLQRDTAGACTFLFKVKHTLGSLDSIKVSGLIKYAEICTCSLMDTNGCDS